MNKTVVLLGNPNVGKSVIFNNLTGRYAVVSNYPGTTVDVSRGVAIISGNNYQIIDTPGTNSLIPFSEDEQVTRDVLFRENPDVVVQVADAKNLKRTLALTLEVMEIKIPMILVLNMSDEALERGITIDSSLLEQRLGIPVIKTVGITGEGIGELKKQISNARVGKINISFHPEIEKLIEKVETIILGKFFASRSLAAMIVSKDKTAWSYLSVSARAMLEAKLQDELSTLSGDPRISIFNKRSDYADDISAFVERNIRKEEYSFLNKFGDLSMRPFPGYVIVFAVLFAMYKFVGVFASGILVDLLENRVFGEILNPLVTNIVNEYIKNNFLRDFLVGEYGLITMAFTYALAIVLPIVSAFFLFFGVLEDSGYLPRLSVMLDRMFRKFGLNGKAVLPMVLGLGCGTMAALSSRILETKKERLLVILLLSLVVPCSAQLGVIMGIIAGLSWKVTALWLGSIVGSLFFVGLLADKVVPGRKSPFVMEIPPLRMPMLKNILLKVKMRLVWYIKEAVPLFMLGTAILFFLDKLKLLATIETIVRPVIVNLLGLPSAVTQAFIIGFLRRDYGAAGLYVLSEQGILNPLQILVSTVTMTLFVPCIAQCLMVVREQGWKVASIIFIFVSMYAVIFGGLLNFVIGSLGIL